MSRSQFMKMKPEFHFNSDFIIDNVTIKKQTFLMPALYCEPWSPMQRRLHKSPESAFGS